MLPSGILICCTGPFWSSSLCLFGFCLPSLQCLISTLAQAGGGDLSFRFASSVQSCYGEGGALQTDIAVCGLHSPCSGHTGFVRPKIRAFVPRRENRATQWTSPADATPKRVYCRLRKQVTLISWEAEHTEQQIGQAFYRQKTILSACYIRVTKWLVTCLQSNPIGTNFAGYMFTKQFYWYKRRGLLFKLRRPRAFQLSRGLFTGCILIGWLQVIRWGRGIPPFHGKPKPKSRPLASPSPGSPT